MLLIEQERDGPEDKPAPTVSDRTRGSRGLAMLRDESGNGGGRPEASRNVLGDRLEDAR
jgi:hypothetical protein